MTAAPTRILLTGAAGQVGRELLRSLQPIGDVIACERSTCDLSDLPGLVALVHSLGPHLVVNAAAYTAVDRAEQDFARAMVINGEAPGVLAEVARQAGALFVHFSTDYVFDGTGSKPRHESDPVAPLNAYGRSKLAGERAVSAAGGDWLVLRTSWIYAARGQNFLNTMLRLATTHETLRVVADQIGAPTSARFLADATSRIVARALDERRQRSFTSEVLHVCASGETSWNGFAKAIFEECARREDKFRLRVKEVSEISSEEYSTPAARPLNSRLDCSRVRDRFGLHLPSWQVGMKLVLDELQDQYPVTQSIAAH